MSYQNYPMMGMSGTNAPVAALTPNFASQAQAQQQQPQPSQHQQQFNPNSQQMQQQQQQRMMMQQMQMRRPYPDTSYGVNGTYSALPNSNPNQQLPQPSMNAYSNMQQSNMGAQYANSNNNGAPNQMQSYQPTSSLSYTNMSMMNDPFRSSAGPSAGMQNPNLQQQQQQLAVNSNGINGSNGNPMSIALANTMSNIDPLTGRRRSIASFSPLPGTYNSNPSTPSDVVGLGGAGGTGSRRASIVEFPQPIRPASLAPNYPLVTPASAVAANAYLPSPVKPPPMNFTSTANNGNGALATPLATRLTPSLAMAASHPTVALSYSPDASNGTDILAAATVVAGNAAKLNKSALSLSSPLVAATIATTATATPASKTAKVSPAPILTKSSPRTTNSSKSISNKKSTTPSPSPPPVASPSSTGTPRSQQSAGTSKGGKNPSATPSPPAVGGKKPGKPRSKPPSCAPNAEELPPGFKKQACTVCHHAKTSCDGRRPCFRCIRLNKSSLCEDRQRKEHLKKKSPPRTSPSQGSKAGKKGSTPTASHRTAAGSTTSRSKRKRASESEEEDDEDEDEEQEDAEMEEEDEQAEDEEEEEEEQEEEDVEAEADHSHEDGEEGHDHGEEAEGEEEEADGESDNGEAAAAPAAAKSAEVVSKAKEGGGKVAAPVALVAAVTARAVQMSDGALPIPTSESIPMPIPIPTSSLPIPVTPNHDGAAADTASLISDVTGGLPANPYISRYMRRRSSTLEGLAATSYLNAGTDAYGGSLARVGGELRSAMVSPSSFLANRRDSLAGGLGFIGSGSLLMNSHGFTPMSPMSIVERTIQSQPIADPTMDHILSYTGTDESGAPLSGSASSSLPHHPVVMPMDSTASHHLLMGRRRSSIGAPLHLGLFTPNVPGGLLGVPPGPLGPPGTLPPRVPGSLGYYPSPAGSVGIPSPNFLAPPVSGLAPTMIPSLTPVVSSVPVSPQSSASAMEGVAAASNSSAAPLPSAFLSGKERLSKSLMASYRSIDVRSKIKEKLEAILREKEQEVPTSADSAAVNKLVMGRLQFYLLQLSELMQEDDWNELVDELPIQVFTSQSARYLSPPPQARKMKSTDSKSETSEESVPQVTVTATTTPATTVPATPDSSVVPSSRKSSVSSASSVSYNYPYGSQCKVSWFESPVLCMEEDDAALVREVRLRRLMKKNLAEGITNPESMDADLKALMAGSMQTGPSPTEVDANSASVAIMKLQPLSVFRAMKRAQRRAHRMRGAKRSSAAVGSAAVDPNDVSAVDHARRVQRRSRKKEKKRAKKLVRREKRKQKQAERKKRKAEKKAKVRAAKKLKTVDANGLPVSVKVEPLESESDFDESSSSDFSSSSSSSSDSYTSAAELSSDYSDTDDEDLGESAAFSASAASPAAAAFNGWLPVRLEKHQLNCKVFLAQRQAAREARRKKRAEAKGGVAALTANATVASTMSPMSDGNPSAANASTGSTPIPAAGSDTKCNCVPSLHLPMIVHVNREWERLFGWTQREIRALMLKDGLRGLGRVTRLDAFASAHKHIFEAILSGASDYRCYATIINKWQCSIPCMAHTRVELSDMDGCFQGYVNTWTPLPQTTQAAE